MGMSSIGFGAMVAASLLSAGAASAATVSFVGTTGGDVASLSGSTGVGGIAFDVAPVATGLENDAALLAQTADGLGVHGFTPGSDIPDFEPGLIDGSIFSTEGITVSFSSAVTLDSFTLGSFSTLDGDDYSLLVNGVLVGSALTLGTNPLALGNVTSFTILAVGDLFSDNFGPQGLLGNDEFTLASFTVSQVPAPAAAGLLLAALGGLAAAGRRRRRTA